MTPEELEKIKNMWGKARGRTIQIVDRDQMDRLTFELHNKIAAMIAHIDSQAAQIEALKEKLVKERAAFLCYKAGRVDKTGYMVFPGTNIKIPEARKQLKAEMPEVGWE